MKFIGSGVEVEACLLDDKALPVNAHPLIKGAYVPNIKLIQNMGNVSLK